MHRTVEFSSNLRKQLAPSNTEVLEMLKDFNFCGRKYSLTVALELKRGGTHIFAGDCDNKH